MTVRRVAIAGFLLLLAVAASAQLTGKFTLKKTRYASGEPIYLQFELTSTLTEPVFFVTGSVYAFCGGYHIEINRGEALRHPRCATGVGVSCLAGTHTMRRGALSVNAFCLISNTTSVSPDNITLKRLDP